MTETPIGSGREAEIVVLSESAVLRRYRQPRDHSDEARAMIYAREQGFPVPRVFETHEHGPVMERLSGPTMLADLARHPWRIWETRRAAGPAPRAASRDRRAGLASAAIRAGNSAAAPRPPSRQRDAHARRPEGDRLVGSLPGPGRHRHRPLLAPHGDIGGPGRHGAAPCGHHREEHVPQRLSPARRLGRRLRGAPGGGGATTRRQSDHPRRTRANRKFRPTTLLVIAAH